jgi:hypothetical protein
VPFSHVVLHFNQEPVDAGVSSYGTGTPGCLGQSTLGTASTPKVGSAAFAITGVNAPAGQLGAILVANTQDLTGRDPFFLGLTVHLDLLNATESGGLDVLSDASGTSYTSIPIPNNPILAGVHYYFQTFWVEPAGFRCSPAILGLMSSRGLDITLQP